MVGVIESCLPSKDRSGCPQVDGALLMPPLQLQVPVVSPLGAPAVLDEPVVLFLDSVTHQDEGVVGPGAAPAGTGHSALVVEQPGEVEQDGERAHLVEGLLDDLLVVGDVHVAFDLEELLVLVDVTRAGVVLPQGVVVVLLESTVVGQPVDCVVGPPSTAAEVGLVAVDQLLLGVLHHRALGCPSAPLGQPVQAFDVSGSAESPARATAALILDLAHCPLLNPVPHVGDRLFALVEGEGGEVDHEFEFGLGGHDKPVHGPSL